MSREEDLARMSRDALSDKAQDVVQDVVNQVGRLAQEELWQRHGGQAPAPWDEAAGQEQPPDHAALLRTVSSAEAGIDDGAVSAEQEGALAADREAMHRSDWENSGPEDELEDKLGAAIDRLLPWRRSK